MADCKNKTYKLFGFMKPVPVGRNCCPTVTFNQRVQGDDQPSVKKSNDPIVIKHFFVRQSFVQRKGKSKNKGKHLMRLGVVLRRGSLQDSHPLSPVRFSSLLKNFKLFLLY